MVVGDLLPLGALHALEIVHLVPPHLHRIHGAARGGGEEHRLDGLPLIEDPQAVGPGDGLLDFLGVGLGAHSPAALRRLPGDVGLAAVDVGAHVGLRVGAGGVLLFPDGVGAGGAGLGLQGLLLKGGGHLRRHHPEHIRLLSRSPEAVCTARWMGRVPVGSSSAAASEPGDGTVSRGSRNRTTDRMSPVPAARRAGEPVPRFPESLLRSRYAIPLPPLSVCRPPGRAHRQNMPPVGGVCPPAAKSLCAFRPDTL